MQIKNFSQCVGGVSFAFLVLLSQTAYGQAPHSGDHVPNSGPLDSLLRSLWAPQPLAELFYQLGNTLHAQERLIETVNAYQQAISLDPSHRPAFVNQGLTFIEMLQFDRAIANFQTVLELPDQALEPASFHAIAFYNLAIIDKRRGHPEAAIAKVKSALALSPNFPQAQLLLTQLQTPSPQEDGTSTEGP